MCASAFVNCAPHSGQNVFRQTKSIQGSIAERQPNLSSVSRLLTVTCPAFREDAFTARVAASSPVSLTERGGRPSWALNCTGRPAPNVTSSCPPSASPARSRLVTNLSAVSTARAGATVDSVNACPFPTCQRPAFPCCPRDFIQGVVRISRRARWRDGGYHDFTGRPQYLVVTAIQPGDGAAQWMRPSWQECGKCHALFETLPGAESIFFSFFLQLRLSDGGRTRLRLIASVGWHEELWLSRDHRLQDGQHLAPSTSRRIYPASTRTHAGSDVEFAPGRSNSEELLLFAVGKLFPKNDNRVLCHLNAAIHGIQDLEIEAQ